MKTDRINEIISFLESWSMPEKHLSAEAFIREMLGYDCTRFHKKWWRHTVKNRVSLVLAPRGHGKSTILTIAFVLKKTLDDPDLRTLIVSNTEAQAKAFLREIKHHLVKNPALCREYGELAGAPWNETEVCIAGRTHGAKEPAITAMGVMGPVISKHYDLIVLDDVVDEQAARTRASRERMLTWYYKELMPTLEPGGELHVIGTRYHHDDLYANLIQSGVPTLVERAVKSRRGRERALWEQKFPLSLLKQKREQAGPAIFNAQYQNDVTAMKGALIRPEWIRMGHAPRSARLYQGVDLAIGKQERHDFFAHVTVAEVPAGYHVLHAFRGRLSFQEQVNAVNALYHLHDRADTPVVKIGVESNSYQKALVERLRNGAGLPATPVTQTRDKVARVMSMQGLFETGNITFAGPDLKKKEARKQKDHLPELIEELLCFPDADHDDLVDALELAVRTARETRRYAELPIKELELGP